MSSVRLFDAQGADARLVHNMPYQTECGAIHAIGNGGVIVYGRGPELMQVFGPPYSSPTALSLVAARDCALTSRTSRTLGANIWTHELPCGSFTDCAPRAPMCFQRIWRMKSAVRMELDFHGFSVIDISTLFPDARYVLLVTVPACAPFYNGYPVSKARYLMLAFTGGIEKFADTLVEFSSEGRMLIVGADEYPECVSSLRRALLCSTEGMLTAARAEDASFSRARLARQTPVKEHPLAARTLAACEDVAFLIRAQQSREGGILAGHNYHMAYMRDQYGASRGLLAIGAWEEAKAILRFYLSVFSHSGKLANAQAMGVPDSFHTHENDAVEITGYLVLQALDMLETTGDRKLFSLLTPMLDWAIDAQRKQLHNSMLPFNGDETYIAGGVLSRAALNHGSLEATLLFIEGGERYLARRIAESPREKWLNNALDDCLHARARFDENFKRGGEYVANSLARLRALKEAPFRHGLCLNGDEFGWLTLSGEGLYYCAKCLSGGLTRGEPCRSEYRLKSALLTAPYIGAHSLDDGIVRREIESYFREYRTIGALPSLPGVGRSMGYDYGLMLFAAARYRLTADDLLQDMLALQDETGAWAEYYDDGVPRQTRCRAWESGVCAAGALAYLSDRPHV